MNHNARGLEDHNFMLLTFLYYFACTQPLVILACLRTYCLTYIYFTAIFQLYLRYSL